MGQNPKGCLPYADQLLTDSGIPRYDGSVDSDPFATHAPQQRLGAMADEETTMKRDALLDYVQAGRSRWESPFEHYDEHLADMPARLEK